MKKNLKRSTCGISCSLEVLGDKWTLLIIRDLFFGKNSYADFLKSDEKIATNILSDRLFCLESQGLITKEIAPDKKSKFLYQLTDKGHALLPVLNELGKWGTKFYATNVESS